MTINNNTNYIVVEPSCISYQVAWIRAKSSNPHLNKEKCVENLILNFLLSNIIFKNYLLNDKNSLLIDKTRLYDTL